MAHIRATIAEQTGHNQQSYLRSAILGSRLEAAMNVFDRVIHVDQAAGMDESASLLPPLPPLTPLPPPVTPDQLKAAILSLLRDGPSRNLFTSLSNSVWDGWASWRVIAWRLPVQIISSPYAYPEEAAKPEVYWNVESFLVEMAEAGWLEKQLHCPLAGSTDHTVRTLQEWQFRIPGYNGYCYWEPSRPIGVSLAAMGIWLRDPAYRDNPDSDDPDSDDFLSYDCSSGVSQENWEQIVSPADARSLKARFLDGIVPQYILAQIERRWLGKRGRAEGVKGRNGRPNLR